MPTPQTETFNDWHAKQAATAHEYQIVAVKQLTASINRAVKAGEFSRAANLISQLESYAAVRSWGE